MEPTWRGVGSGPLRGASRQDRAFDDLEGELARLRAEGVAITMPLTSEEWGERAFQVRDPNGVIVQLVDWNARTGE